MQPDGLAFAGAEIPKILEPLRLLAFRETAQTTPPRANAPPALCVAKNVSGYGRYGFLSFWSVPAVTTYWVYNLAGYDSGGDDVNGRGIRGSYHLTEYLPEASAIKMVSHIPRRAADVHSERPHQSRLSA